VQRLLLPREDFGITPIEANAAGKPSSPTAAGGALETMEEGTTAAFFHDQTVEDVQWAIRRVLHMHTAPEDLCEAADRFSPRTFERNLCRAVRAAVAGLPAGEDARSEPRDAATAAA
jgi:glycosyltransferase involved in cell wall biosynthesis